MKTCRPSASAVVIGAALGLVAWSLHHRGGDSVKAASSITFVQSASTAQTGGQTAGKAFPGSVTSGDLIIVGVFVDLGATVSVTDSLGGSFTQVAHQTVASDHDADVFVATAGASGADTITVNAGSGRNVYAFSIHEYGGVTAAIDAFSTAQGNSTAPASGNLTTVTPNDLVFVWFTNGSNFQNENFTALNPAYTQREMSGSGTAQCYAFANCVESGDLMAATTLTTNATATLNVSDIWSATAIAFKGTESAPSTWSISGGLGVSGSGATVTLTGASTAAATADASGNYTFTGLANGSYTVTPGTSGYTFSPASLAVTLNGANVTGINFTATLMPPPTWSISGGLGASGSGATVALTGASTGTTTADGSGNYTFTGLANGSYTVTPGKSGYTFSPTSLAVTLNGANATGINFTATLMPPPTWSISGGLGASGSGATVTLTGASTAATTADGSGNYTFTSLANGAYTVTPAKSGYTFSPTSLAVTLNGANVTGINFTATLMSAPPITFVQSASTAQTGGQTAGKAFPGSVTSGDLIIVGVFVDLGAAVSVTDSLGGSFTQVAHQTVASDHDADVFVATAGASGADTITVNAGSGRNVYAFSIHEYGGVTAAVDAASTAQGKSTAPASGNLTTVTPNDLVFVWFTNGSNFQNENFTALNPAYTQREMSGSGTAQCYAFANCVESGDLMAATTLTTNATATLNVSDIWSATAIAFKGAESAPSTWSISGGLGVSGSGATVTLTGASTATTTADGSGNYTLTGLANGSYTVTPGKSGYTFSPTSLAVTLNGANVTGINFTATLMPPPTWSISGGLGASGSGATVALTGALTAGTTADGSGNYTFRSLANGSYTVTPGKSGYTFSPTSLAVTVNGANVTGINFTATLMSAPAITFVQSASTAQTGGQTAGKAFPGSVTSGDLIIVGVFVDLGAAVSVTDSLGGSFTQVAHQTVASDHDADVFVATAGASGADTIMVNAGSGRNVYAFSIHEYGGVTAAVDAASTTQGKSTAPASGNLTTVTPNDLVFVWFTNGSNFQNENFNSLTPALTKREMSGSGTAQCYAFANCVESGDLIAVTTLTTNATATLNVSDIWSATAIAFKGAASVLTDTTPPTVPTNLSAIAASPSQINLSWSASTDNIGVAGYQVFRNGAKIATSTGTSFSDTPLIPSTTYNYTVTAFDAAGNVSAQSLPASATTLPPDTTPPSTPTGFHALAITSSYVTLSWNASTDNVGVAGYRVFRNDVQVGTTTQTSYTDGPLAASTSYRYTVAAFDAAGNVSPTVTPEVTVTTLPVSSSLALPLKASANGLYLVDQNNVPAFVIGDSPHSLLVDLDSSTMSTYMADRQARGFNAILVQVLCNPYTGGYPNGATYDGVAPFTSGSSPSDYDLSTPNPAYFSRLDSLVAMAAADQLTVFLDPIDTGGWMTTLEANGATKAFNYGVYLGSRYRNTPNIVWDSGNDFNDWNTNATDNNLVYQVMAGIASVDPNHLQTIEINALSSYSTQDTTLGPLITLNSVYTYAPTYDMVLQAYNSGAGIPAFMTEANYEYENNVGALPGLAGALVLREQEYWSLLSGATSQLYGNHYTWTFNGPEGQSNWQSFLDSPGATQIQYFTGLFQPFPWWNLVPDASHVVVTAGYGSYDASNYDLTANTYSPTAWVTDGSLSITYDVTGGTVTVNMAEFKSAVTARWYDPSNGAYTTIQGSPFVNSGSVPFTPPGNNGGGDSDWVLVLQAGSM